MGALENGILKCGRADIIDAIQKLSEGETSKAAADEALRQVTNALVYIFTDELEAEKPDLLRLTVPNFGAFEIRRTKARKGRNVKTGKIIDIPASRKLTFSPATALKTSIKSVE